MKFAEGKIGQHHADHQGDRKTGAASSPGGYRLGFVAIAHSRCWHQAAQNDVRSYIGF
jgi:hypothetical protein